MLLLECVAAATYLQLYAATTLLHEPIVSTRREWEAAKTAAPLREHAAAAVAAVAVALPFGHGVAAVALLSGRAAATTAALLHQRAAMLFLERTAALLRERRELVPRTADPSFIEEVTLFLQEEKGQTWQHLEQPRATKPALSNWLSSAPPE